MLCGFPKRRMVVLFWCELILDLQCFLKNVLILLGIAMQSRVNYLPEIAVLPLHPADHLVLEQLITLAMKVERFVRS